MFSRRLNTDLVFARAYYFAFTGKRGVISPIRPHDDDGSFPWWCVVQFYDDRFYISNQQPDW